MVCSGKSAIEIQANPFQIGQKIEIVINFKKKISLKMQQKVEITFNLTKDINLKLLVVSKNWEKHKCKRVSFSGRVVGWVDGIFFLSQSGSELSTVPSKARPLVSLRSE